MRNGKLFRPISALLVGLVAVAALAACGDPKENMGRRLTFDEQTAVQKQAVLKGVNNPSAAAAVLVDSGYKALKYYPSPRASKKELNGHIVLYLCSEGQSNPDCIRDLGSADAPAASVKISTSQDSSGAVSYTLGAPEWYFAKNGKTTMQCRPSDNFPVTASTLRQLPDIFKAFVLKNGKVKRDDRDFTVVNDAAPNRPSVSVRFECWSTS